MSISPSRRPRGFTVEWKNPQGTKEKRFFGSVEDAFAERDRLSSLHPRQPRPQVRQVSEPKSSALKPSQIDFGDRDETAPGDWAPRQRPDPDRAPLLTRRGGPLS